MLNPDSATWSRMTYGELDALAEHVAALPDLPPDVKDAIGYWRAEHLGVQRSALRVLILAQSSGVRW